MSDLKKLVRDLAQARQMTEIAEDSVRWTKKEISETALGIKLAEEEEIVRLAKADEAAARAALDKAVLAQFDGGKRPHPAITGKDFVRYQYDQNEAREWAELHMRAALVLDARKFEAGIKALGAPVFVETVVEQRVTVSSDLSRFVE